MAKTQAPYNFVPFLASKQPLIRYASMEELPRQDVLAPQLKTGELHVTLTADSPVFVSDGEKEAHFFRDARGTCCIPGSTVRGMLRSNMKILGLGMVHSEEDLADRQIFFRKVAAKRRDEETGGTSIDKALQEYYQNLLDVHMASDWRSKPHPIPRKVQGGYLGRDQEGLYIRPVPECYLVVSRTLLPDWADKEACTVRVAYTRAGDQVRTLQISDAPLPGMEFGTLLITGKPISKFPNSFYLFPEPAADAPRIPVPREDQTSYEQDWEGRHHGLRNPDFWKVPAFGEEKPVFYTTDDGHLYFGMSLFLRIGYQYPLHHGLPQAYQQLWDRELEGERVLDYPSAVFGFAGKDRSLRSRVRCGDFRAVGPVSEEPLVQVPLMEPKPSFYAGYTVNGTHYGDPEFRLRGWKRYWLKEPTPMEGKENVLTQLRPLPAGTRFQGVIRYQNLTEDELGLLLWSLLLEPGCYQSLGQGRPYGYGRMKVKLTQLREADLTALYRPEGLCSGLETAPEDRAEQYIQAYDRFAMEKLKIKKKKGTLRDQEALQDFFFLCRELRKPEESSYMALGDYANCGPLPTVTKLRQELQDQEAQTPAEPEDPYAALLAKFGSKHKH